MKNRKLYESIQRLVHKKDSVKKNKQTFADEYCKEQMRKKKLTPRHLTSKIDELMKNFKKINTFIDVDELIRVVNQLYLEEEKQLKKEIITHNEQQTICTHKKYNSQISEPNILNKARDALKDYHLHLYNQENDKIADLVQEFEKNSHYLCQTMKNKQKYGLVTKMRISKKSSSIQKIKDNQEEVKQKWNLYSRANNYIKTEPNEENINIQTNRELTNGYKKKKKMFVLAQIYLQMILQEQYRKKWNKDNKNTFQLKINNESNIKRFSILKKGGNKQNADLPTQIQESKNSSQKTSQINSQIMKINSKTGFCPIDSPMSLSTRARCLQSRSNTKMLRSKEIAIQKVNNFIMDLEEDQNCLKNEKKLHLYHLDRLQKQFDEHRLLKSNKIWRDQQKCQQIKLALQRQDKK